MNGIPGRAISPDGHMIKLIHLSLTGNPEQRGIIPPARDGWQVIITHPRGFVLDRLYIGPDLSDETAVARVAGELAGACERRGFSAADLTPVTVEHQPPGWRHGQAPRFGADPADITSGTEEDS
jgi:hypothetical protein